MWPYLDEAAAAAGGSGEPQWLAAARLARAEAHWLAGDTALALAEADLARAAAVAASPWDSGAALTWLRRCGAGEEAPGPVAEPFQRELDGYPEKAAQLWLDLGCRYQAGLALYDTDDERLLRQALELFTGLRRDRRGQGDQAEDAPRRHQVDPGRPEVRHPGRSARADPA